MPVIFKPFVAVLLIVVSPFVSIFPLIFKPDSESILYEYSTPSIVNLVSYPSAGTLRICVVPLFLILPEISIPPLTLLIFSKPSTFETFPAIFTPSRPLLYILVLPEPKFLT